MDAVVKRLLGELIEFEEAASIDPVQEQLNNGFSRI